MSVLDGVAFRGRLDQEVARVRRSGGFVSVAALQVRVSGDAATCEAQAAQLAARLALAVRLHDVVGRDQARLLVLLPDATMKEATLAARRLLDIVRVPGTVPAAPQAAGVASAYGAVEGGGPALLAAAEEAVGTAADGAVAPSVDFTGRPRLLVVDDDAGFAELLAEQVSQEDWEAHPCSQLADALVRVKANTYAGLFVDLVLPGGSGVDILRCALSINPRLPAVLMSGHDAMHDAIIEALDLGPVMFVRKPLSYANLQSALRMFRDLLPGALGRTR